MPGTPLLLAIDQGTTSSRAIVFDAGGSVRTIAQREFTQHFPAGGWVEHDPEEIWSATLAVTREALAAAGGAVAAIGITNQRETTVVWDRASGAPIHRAIVWQDRRTAAKCRALRDAGHESAVSEKTGLLLDPYFSATKLAWTLDHVDGARDRASAGELAFGTIDTFLIWRLTGGRVHATDATNASRTLLFDIHTQAWDDTLLQLFDVPRSVLPEVRDSAADFGTASPEVLGQAIPIAGVAGDQQAATVGQACFRPGMMKSTYGTGCFAVMNTGAEAVRSRNRLLTTVAWRLEGEPTYALEGSIFVAGAAVQWLRDGLRVIDDAPQTEALASGLPDSGGVYLVPAFTGLGAPHWDPDARGAIYGLTRDAGPAHLARAALESVCFQTRDLIAAMEADRGAAIDRLRVDGGMIGNAWLLQALADIVGVTVERPRNAETTALGAAYLAGLQAGVFRSLDDIGERWARDAECTPRMADRERERLVRGWESAVARTLEHRA
ncbi:MAG: glycerol kinase GlpK [Chromatiales bacterium]|nr:glycerol kinase GlpK [Chromatiales bacterium]